MSMTKNSAAFDRMMEEARLEEENSYELYAEELYLNGRKAAMPAQEKPTPEGITNTAEKH